MRINQTPLSIANPLHDLFHDPFFRFDWTPRRSMSHVSAVQLPVDFYEDEDHYFVRAELPGVKKEALKIELDQDVLTLSYDHQSEAEERSVRRSIRVPQDIQHEAIRANLEDGILTLTLPKGEVLKPREIAVS